MSKIIKKSFLPEYRDLILLAYRVIDSYTSSGLENISPLFFDPRKDMNKVVLDKIKEVAEIYGEFHSSFLTTTNAYPIFNHYLLNLLEGVRGVYRNLLELEEAVCRYRPEFMTEMASISAI